MSLEEFIASGVLETYVLGQASLEEFEEVEKMRAIHPSIDLEILEIQLSNENFAFQNSIKPHPTAKPLLFATFDYIARLEAGEPFCEVPELNKNSKIGDFKEWIDRPDMAFPPEEFEDIHVKIISAKPEMTCAIVWIKELAPEEVHHVEYEKFLILEGTCTIVVGEKENKLVAGDYFAIPLFEDHKVLVTSIIPCKVILQRIAA